MGPRLLTCFGYAAYFQLVHTFDTGSTAHAVAVYHSHVAQVTVRSRMRVCTVQRAFVLPAATKGADSDDAFQPCFS